jgi:DNA-binding response OmpR family regulator
MNANSKPHVLVVDDSLTVRMDLQGALQGAGFQVTTCATKGAAREALQAHSFVVAILDVVLPDGDGVELLGEIKANAAWSRTAVILLSSESEVRDRIRGMATGADEYVGKPYDTLYVVRRACRLADVADPYEQSVGLAALSGSKVLLVDDSATFLTALAGELRRDNHDIVIARSAKEGLELLRLQAVDCVIMDLVMPEIDGIEACRRMRALPGRERIPFMIVTATENRTARREALAAGVDDFVIKSADFDLLRVRVRGLLRKHRGDQSPRSETSSQQSGLYGRIIAASGLSEAVAKEVLGTACRRSGFEPFTITAAELTTALPAIRDALSTQMSAAEATRRSETMAALARLHASRRGK